MYELVCFVICWFFGTFINKLFCANINLLLQTSVEERLSENNYGGMSSVWMEACYLSRMIPDIKRKGLLSIKGRRSSSKAML